MAGRKTPTLPGPDERHFTVRFATSRACLTTDPGTTWRWSEPSQATLMTRAEAEAAVARMGGVICVDGVPVDKLGVALPKRPPPVRGKTPGERADVGATIRDHVAAGRWREAFRIAVKLRGLGDDAKVIARAQDGLARPDFCRQLGRDPDVLVEAGKAVLRRRWGT